LALALLLLTQNGLAETLRVTTWNLGLSPAAEASNAAAETNQFGIQQAAATLRNLNPDVILLQQVRDWKMCDQLAQALKPADYKVLICSSFGDARNGASRRQQVAILSRTKAYFAWSEAWRKEAETVLPGGLAFAALQIGKQRVGLFSVEAGTASVEAPDAGQSATRLKAQTASLSRLLEQVRSVKNWVTNQVQVFVVTGTFDLGRQDRLAARDAPLRLLEEAGFGNAFLQGPAGERSAQPGMAGPPGGMADYIFTQPAGCAANPRTQSALGFERQPITCEVELDPAKVAAAQVARAEALRASEALRSSQANASKAEVNPDTATSTSPPLRPGPPAPAAASQPSTLKLQLRWLTAAALGGIALVAAIMWLLARRRRAFGPATPALITERAEGGRDLPSSYTVVLGTRSATEPPPADRSAWPEPRHLFHIETSGATHTHAEVLRQRALAAEQRADRANAVIRSGLIPHLSRWLKQKLVRKLVTDRAQLLETQQAATLKAVAVEERLARIERQIQRQNDAYQERIEALTRELVAAKEENRELIRARIAQVKAEMEAARVRIRAEQ
jgi:hypothetical protein